MVIGLIADTHGLFRPSVHGALAGVDVILHAGDVGGHEILDELALIAPVHAVHGNTDPVDDPRLPAEVAYRAGALAIHVSHGHELAPPTPARLLARYAEDVLVYGHTHKALIARAGERLVVNPGAAGPGRFDLRPSVARLTVDGGHAEVEIVRLSE
jgi:hypothetical protein